MLLMRFRSSCGICSKPMHHKSKSGLCVDCFAEERDNTIIANWLATGLTGNKTVGDIPNAIRRYVLNRQESKCCICGIDSQWNGKSLTLIVDHINGDASNSSSENLRAICPNCDSQLDTYKSRNKGSARIRK